MNDGSTQPNEYGWQVQPRAVMPAPNFALSSLSLWRRTAKTIRQYRGMTTPGLSGAQDWAVAKTFSVPVDIQHSIIMSGPAAAMWGLTSGIS